ncbi:hypothetical protein GCM10027037_03340 [Mucilaginibacter koreensis]
MAESQYYAEAYQQPDQAPEFYRPAQGSASQWVGHLTADDNGAAQVIDMGKLYQNLTGPAQARQRQQAELDKQLRLAYMAYDAGKMPQQYREGYKKLLGQHHQYYFLNQKALRRGDIAAAMELEKRQNALKDYAAQSAQQAQVLKSATQRIMGLAPKRSTEWVKEQMDKLHAQADPYEDLTTLTDYSGGVILDPYKAENSLLKQIAKPLQVRTGTARNGAPVYTWVPQSQQNLQAALNFATRTPEGQQLVNEIADANDVSHADALQQYVKAKQQELDQRSLGGVNGMPKYDDHAFNAGIKQGMYNMATDIHPLRKRLMESQIARNLQQQAFGNSQMLSQQYYDDLANNIVNNPQAAADAINNTLPAKSWMNGGQPLTYNPETNTIEGTVFKGGNKMDVISWPATPEGAQQAILNIQSSVVNPSQAATQQRLKRPKKTPLPTPAAKPTNGKKKKAISGF